MLASLGIIDQLVLVVTVVVAIAVGLAFAGKNRSLETFLLGNRDLPWWAILGSIVATETSTATVLSVPGEGYGTTGMRFLQLAIGLIVGRIIVVFVLLPMYFKGSLFSAYEVLGNHFGEATKRTASSVFLVARNLGDGLRLYLAAIVVQQLVGWPLAASAVCVGVVTMLYTFFGGMRSVVWNDCIQFLIYMAGGLVSIFVIASMIPGGWESLWSFIKANDKLRIIDFDLSQNFNFFGGLLGGAVLSIGTHGTDQMMVQRYLSARSQRDAGKAIMISGFVVFLQFALFLFIGVELAGYYNAFPEAAPEKADQVFAHFIVNVFPKNTGIVGLLLAAVLAAAMSTLSSSLNSSASAMVNDFIIPRQRRSSVPPDDQKLFAITRYLTIGFGVIQIAIGIFASSLGDTVVSNALRIAGISFGLLLGLYLLALFAPSVGQTSALSGCGIGFLLLLVAQFGAPRLGVTIGVPWLALIGASTTYCSGYCVALLTSDLRDKAD